jgi:hypothetical protein
MLDNCLHGTDTWAMETKQTPEPASEFYQAAELAQRLGRSYRWVWTHREKLPGVRETYPGSGIYLFLKREVDAYYGWKP